MTYMPEVMSHLEIKDADCLICKYVMKLVVHALKNDYTKDKIEKVLKKACKKIPLKNCQHFLDKHFDQIVELLLNAATREKVCESIGVCFVENQDENVFSISSEQEERSDVATMENVEIGECLICKGIVKATEEILKNDYTKDKIERALKRACKNLHIKKCQSFLDKHFDEIVKLLLDASTRGKVCQLIGVCSLPPLSNETEDFLPDLSENKYYVVEEDYLTDIEDYYLEEEGAIVECVLCKAILKMTEKILNNDHSKDHIEKTLKEVCTKVHSKKCSKFVDEHFDQIVKLLLDASTGGILCLATFFPNGTLGFTHLFEVAQSMINRDLPNDDSIKCVACRLVVDSVLQIFKGNITRGVVEWSFKLVCRLLPEDYEHECVQWIHANFQHVADLIVKYGNSRTLCCYVSLCPDRKPNNSFLSQQNSSSEMTAIINSQVDLLPDNVQVGECLICKAIVKASKKILKNSYTRDKIRGALNKACKKVHFKKCQSFLRKHFDQMVSLLLKATTRGRVCRIIGVCSISPVVKTGLQLFQDAVEEAAFSLHSYSALLSYYPQAPFLSHIPNNVQVGECLICKAIVKASKEILKNSYTRDKIRGALNKACKKVHFKKCQSFLRKHFDQMVNLLLKATTRGRVCRIIGVCSINPLLETGLERFQDAVEEAAFSLGSDSALISYYPQADVLSHIPNNVQVGECLICKAITKATKEILKNSYTRDKIRGALNKACKKVHFKKCQSFLRKHFDQMVSLLLKATTRGRVCRIIGVCSISPVVETGLQLFQDAVEEAAFSLHSYSALLSYYTQAPFLSHIPNNVQVGECLICKAIVKASKKILKNSYTRDKIRGALNKACKKVHFKKCQSFLRKHFDQMVNLLLKATTRGRVCRIIGVCSINPLLETGLELFQDAVEEAASSLEPSYQVSSYKYCAVCHNVLHTVKILVKPPFNKAKIQAALRTVCSKLPRQLKICQQFLPQYFKQLVNLIQNGRTRNSVCEVLKLCPNKKPTTTCKACFIGVDVFRNAMRSNHLGVFLGSKVVNICHILPSFLQNLCKGQVRTYWPQLLRFLRTIPLAWACGKIGACKASSTEDLQIVEYKFDKVECASCEPAINLLRRFAEIPEFQQQIHVGFQLVCNSLTSPLAETCLDGINSNWDQWIRLLRTTTSQSACYNIGRCPPLNSSSTDILSSLEM